MAFVLQLIAKLLVVLDDAVVDENDAAALVGVRMGVFAGHRSVGSPARVADPAVAMNRLVDDQLGEVLDATDRLADLEGAVVAEGNTGRIVAAVFQTAQPVQEDGRRFSRADVADNSTHNKL